MPLREDPTYHVELRSQQVRTRGYINASRWGWRSSGGGKNIERFWKNPYGAVSKIPYEAVSKFPYEAVSKIPYEAVSKFSIEKSKMHSTESQKIEPRPAGGGSYD